MVAYGVAVLFDHLSCLILCKRTIEDRLCEQLKATIEKIFQYSRQQAEQLLTELLLCVQDKQLAS